MISCCSNKGCAIVCKLLMLLVLITEIAAIVGVYNAHLATGGMTFGSTTGSLSILALAINSMVLLKFGQMHCKECSKK